MENTNCIDAVKNIDNIITNIKDDLQNKIKNYEAPIPPFGLQNDMELWSVVTSDYPMTENNMSQHYITNEKIILNESVWNKKKSDANALLTEFNELNVEEQTSQIEGLKEYIRTTNNNYNQTPPTTHLYNLNELIKKYFPIQLPRLHIYETLIKLKKLKIDSCNEVITVEDKASYKKYYNKEYNDYYPKNYMKTLLSDRNRLIRMLKPSENDGITWDEFDNLLISEFYDYYDPQKDYDTRVDAFKILHDNLSSDSVTKINLTDPSKESTSSKSTSIIPKIASSIRNMFKNTNTKVYPTTSGGKGKKTKKYKRTARKQRKVKQRRTRK